MGRQTVIQAANREAQAQGFQVAKYKIAHVTFRSSPSNSVWHVIYNIQIQAASHEPLRFGIQVDDQTGRAGFLFEEFLYK
jgi:hypothetical protein